MTFVNVFDIVDDLVFSRGQFVVFIYSDFIPVLIWSSDEESVEITRFAPSMSEPGFGSPSDLLQMEALSPD